MQPLRVIVDRPGAGDWNMALDEALAEQAEAQGIATLRLYAWEPATLSLGYFQRYDERVGHLPSRELACVRRPSGGGAIVHDRELTYSLAIPDARGQKSRREALYRIVHAAIIEVFAACGANLDVCGSTTAKRGAGSEPFLCFERRAAGDLLCGSAKVVGSAQRRNRGAVLQHGSILLGKSPHAPDLPGIEDLSSRTIERELLADSLAQVIGSALNMSPQSVGIEDSTRGRADELVAAKYANTAWTHRR
jgi:lipoate-protein ligase A